MAQIVHNKSHHSPSMRRGVLLYERGDHTKVHVNFKNYLEALFNINCKLYLADVGYEFGYESIRLVHPDYWMVHKLFFRPEIHTELQREHSYNLNLAIPLVPANLYRYLPNPPEHRDSLISFFALSTADHDNTCDPLAHVG